MAFSFDEVRDIAAKSLDIGISFDESEDMTRQEFKEECDVNHILRQHGYTLRPVRYGEHDFDADLTSKMQSRSVFQAFYEAAPDVVRDKYPDLGSFMAAFGSGAFVTPSGGVEPPSGGSTPPEGQQAGEAGALG
jgi:hypothetical protein